jgi:hypothetical protein
MNRKIASLQATIIRLEKELTEEMETLSKRFEYTIEHRKIRFHQSAGEYHKKLKKSGFRFVLDANPLNVLVSPIILLMAIPLVFVDVSVYIYQLVCFPVYKIKKVPRSDFIVFDRQNLEYLNYLEKFNCFYCSYANGVFAWIREVTARTEGFWCPIKHAKRLQDVHSQYDGFVDFGDVEGYVKKMKELGQIRP